MPIQPKQQPPYYKEGVNSRSFIALLTQAGTTAPTITVLQNTFNEQITAAYSGEGNYDIIKSPIFKTGRLALLINQDFSAPGGKAIMFDNEDGSVKIKTYGTAMTQENNQLWLTTIKIEEYV